MRLTPWLLLSLVLALLAIPAPLPALAADDPSIVTVDIREADDDLPPLLAPEEVETIRRLQAPPALTLTLSPISPDDQVALALVGEELGFLNIQDTTFAPLSLTAFESYFPLALFGLGSFHWRDERTLISVGLIATPASVNEPAFGVIAIDRQSGALSGVPMILAPNDFPIDISPDGSRALIVTDESQQEALPETQQVQIGWPQPAGQLIPKRLPAALQQRADALVARMAILGAPLTVLDALAARAALQVNETLFRISVDEVATGARTPLREVPPGFLLGSLAWSPDGAKIAISFLGLLDAEASSRSFFDGALISEQIYKDATGQLPPEQNPLIRDNTVELFDLNGAPTRILRAIEASTKQGEARPLLFGITWSPDSKLLLTLALHPSQLAGRQHPIYTPQFNQRMSYRLLSPELAELRRIESPEFSALQAASVSFVGPDELIVAGLVGSNVHPYYVNLATGEFRNLADRAGVYVNIAATSQRDRQLVFIHSSYAEPPELYRMRWDGSGLTRLSWGNAELAAQASIRQDPVSFRLASGATRVGTLIQPAGASFPPQNARLVVWQEGGPGVGMFNFWLSNVENPYTLLPSFGFALLVVPAAGRPGYGPADYKLLYDGGNYGQRDVDELAEIVQQAIRRGWTSRGQVGITGCSYGGYFAWQSIIRHPDLYAAANPQCALVDVFIEWSRGFPALTPYTQGRTPFEAPAEYVRDSPIYNAARVKAAVLSFHGDGDFLPITLNENLHQQLVALGVPARFVKFAGAGHGLRLEEYQRYAAQEQIAWFREHLR
jgi:dipeptidyl aminopeptidase/acylaminoacyl peptidase